MTVTQKLVDEINIRKNLTYPQKGYLLFQDVAGNGQNIKSLYIITNDNGAVSYSNLNAPTPRKRCDNLRNYLLNGFLKLPDERYTVNREWCGYEQPMFIPRFCSEWFSDQRGGQVRPCLTYDSAVAHCILHNDCRLDYLKIN